MGSVLVHMSFDIGPYLRCPKRKGNNLTPAALWLLTFMCTYAVDPEGIRYGALPSGPQWKMYRRGRLNGKDVPAQRFTMSRNKVIWRLYRIDENDARYKSKDETIRKLLTEQLIPSGVVRRTTEAHSSASAEYDLFVAELYAQHANEMQRPSTDLAAVAAELEPPTFWTPDTEDEGKPSPV